jgi:cyclic pyranopterin phosphate synthase
MNPELQPLIDVYGRTHTDLRIAVTDRCNVRCAYCMSSEDAHPLPHDAILSYEEIARFVAVAAPLGIRKLRLTGGEPLVRKDVTRLVAMLVAVPGIQEVAMTTNGILLAEHAAALKAAGLQRLNISLDALSPERFCQATRRDELPRVLEGIAAARAAGFDRIKLNTVAIRGLTEEEIVPLARFAREHDLELRFIEFMPLDGDRQWAPERVLSGEDILAKLAAAFGPLDPVASETPQAPARQYRYADGGGRVGLVPAVSHPFCSDCNRLRLTADGKLRNCLFAAEPRDVRALLRGGGSDRQIVELIREAVAAKRMARGRDDGQFAPAGRPMYQIGG